MTPQPRVYICESAENAENWRDGRRLVERYASYREAWERMNVHLRDGRRAFCGTLREEDAA